MAAWVVRQTLGGVRREPGVPKNLLTRPWTEQSIGRSSVVFNAPFRLQGVSVPLPKELSGKVQQWTWIGREADGLDILVSHVVFAEGSIPSLEGAADGMVRNVEAVPGTKSVTPRRTPTTLLGRPAIEAEMRIEREKSEPLLMHGIVVLKGPELIQFLSIARADQPLASQAWARMRDSVRSR